MLIYVNDGAPRSSRVQGFDCKSVSLDSHPGNLRQLGAEGGVTLLRRLRDSGPRTAKGPSHYTPKLPIGSAPTRIQTPHVVAEMNPALRPSSQGQSSQPVRGYRRGKRGSELSRGHYVISRVLTAVGFFDVAPPSRSVFGDLQVDRVIGRAEGVIVSEASQAVLRRRQMLAVAS